MTTRELRVNYANQESFYKKAFIKEDDNSTQYLYSNYSLILTNYGKCLKFEANMDLYSNTTMKHVREYLRQINRGELAMMTKTKLFNTLKKTNYIILDIL